MGLLLVPSKVKRVLIKDIHLEQNFSPSGTGIGFVNAVFKYETKNNNTRIWYKSMYTVAENS